MVEPRKYETLRIQTSLFCYHDNQDFSGRSQRLQGLGLIGGSLVVEGRPRDVKLPGPVDGPRPVDVVIIHFGFQRYAVTENETGRFRERERERDGADGQR